MKEIGHKNSHNLDYAVLKYKQLQVIRLYVFIVQVDYQPKTKFDASTIIFSISIKIIPVKSHQNNQSGIIQSATLK